MACFFVITKKHNENSRKAWDIPRQGYPCKTKIENENSEE